MWCGGVGFLKETNALNKSPPEGPDTENPCGKDKKRKKKENIQNAADVVCGCGFFFFSFFSSSSSFSFGLSNCYPSL